MPVHFKISSASTVENTWFAPAAYYTSHAAHVAPPYPCISLQYIQQRSQLEQRKNKSEPADATDRPAVLASRLNGKNKEDPHSRRREI